VLGAAQSTQCSTNVAAVVTPPNAVLSGAFFYLCSDSTTLNAFAPPFMTVGAPTGIDTNVVPGSLQALGGVRGVYRKTDGNFYSSDGSTKVVLTKSADIGTVFTAVNNWVFFYDSTGVMSRVSLINGAMIDEPL